MAARDREILIYFIMFISVIAFRNNVRFLPVTATHIFMYLNLDNHSITTATLYIITHTRPHQEKYQDVDGKYKESMVIYSVEARSAQCIKQNWTLYNNSH